MFWTYISQMILHFHALIAAMEKTHGIDRLKLGKRSFIDAKLEGQVGGEYPYTISYVSRDFFNPLFALTKN